MRDSHILQFRMEIFTLCRWKITRIRWSLCFFAPRNLENNSHRWLLSKCPEAKFQLSALVDWNVRSHAKQAPTLNLSETFTLAIASGDVIAIGWDLTLEEIYRTIKGNTAKHSINLSWEPSILSRIYRPYNKNSESNKKIHTHTHTDK